MIPDTFAAFILTHKRPDRQFTLSILNKCGYTGSTYLIVDNEDPTLADYQRQYGSMVIVFDKREAWSITDDADNSGNARGVVYARNMCWKIARGLGLTHFLVLDDDYSWFGYRFDSALTYRATPIRRTFDDMVMAMVRFLDVTQAGSIAMSQGGDHIGGAYASANRLGPSCRRKVMNTFFCATDRPFKFYGRINEDTTAYVTLGRRGTLFLTLQQLMCDQRETQQNPGGLTEIYLDSGTYYKSFLSVLWEPSCVKIAMMGDNRAGRGQYRIHHRVDWSKAVPCIVRESLRKPDDEVPDGD